MLYASAGSPPNLQHHGRTRTAWHSFGYQNEFTSKPGGACNVSNSPVIWNGWFESPYQLLRLQHVPSRLCVFTYNHRLTTMGVKMRYFHGTSIHLMLAFALQIFAACYYPDGNVTDDHPCDPSASTSSCCGGGWVCQPNGLCKDRHSESWARGTCTDKDWASSACPQICTRKFLLIHSINI